MRKADTVRTRDRGFRLTERQVSGQGRPDWTHTIYDGQLPGFGVRVTKGGTKSFVLNYKFKGRERRLTIGRYPTWSVQAARSEAQRLRREIDVGNDPLEQRTRYRSRPTIKDLCARFASEHLPRKRPSSQRNDLANIKRLILPTIGRLAVEEVTFADIDRLHRSLSDTPYQAACGPPPNGHAPRRIAINCKRA